MAPEWFCGNCELVTELDGHLKCGMCGSDAIAPAEVGKMPERVPTFEEAAVEALREA